MMEDMHPTEFIKSIYLGDRACKAVLVDSWRKRVAIQVDVISRLEPGAKTWDFYTDADIANGWLVFSEVSSCSFDPSGPLPNDLINDFTIEPLSARYADQARFLFKLSIGSIDPSGNSTEVIVKIEAEKVHLEDPTRPGLEIA